jgi:sulfite dehydrogenase
VLLALGAGAAGFFLGRATAPTHTKTVAGGTTPAASPNAAGKQVFQTAGCGGCHTLKDAGSGGTVGPNLDQAKPTFAIAKTRVTTGGGAMPPFKGQLTSGQIDAVAKYVSSVAGK